MKISGVCVLVGFLGFSAALLSDASVEAAMARTGLYAPVGEVTSAPIGYVQFCRQQPRDCGAPTQDARDVVMTKPTWNDLKAVNDAVNGSVHPVTDQEFYGKPEVWTYPVDGMGDCEDYVLLKRRMLLDAGWPASALLITVVRDLKGDGHAVLMVKTDRGEFVLDNQVEAIRDWRDTGYRYVKRQSQFDPNQWVSLGDTQTTPTVAAQ